jgi:hypothetical protein
MVTECPSRSYTFENADKPRSAPYHTVERTVGPARMTLKTLTPGPGLAAPACAHTWIRLASSTGRSGGRASERLMVTVEFKPKPTAMAAFLTLIDENALMSREREPGHVASALPCSYPWADDCILLWEIYDSRAAFSVTVAALRRIRQDQRRLVMNNSVTGLDLNFEGSNNRR